MPMAPLLEVVAPTRSSPKTAPDGMIHHRVGDGHILVADDIDSGQEAPPEGFTRQDASPGEYIYPEATDQEGVVLIE